MVVLLKEVGLIEFKFELFLIDYDWVKECVLLILEFWNKILGVKVMF